MRFRQINLDRYGIFTDRTIDLGERKAAGDMHIVYGPNEAGKSTFRSACLDFLFGFGRTTQYDFLHPVDVLQIGARVEFGGTTFEAQRPRYPLPSTISRTRQIVSIRYPDENTG